MTISKSTPKLTNSNCTVHAIFDDVFLAVITVVIHRFVNDVVKWTDPWILPTPCHSMSVIHEYQFSRWIHSTCLIETSSLNPY